MKKTTGNGLPRGFSCRRLVPGSGAIEAAFSSGRTETRESSPIAALELLPEPFAPERPQEGRRPGFEDSYGWLRDREEPEVRAYLEEENAYLERVLSSVRELRQRLEAELKARVPGEDRTAPWRCGPYLYYRRYLPEADYPLICRLPVGASAAAEEVLLDGNRLAAASAFFHLCRFEPSPSGRFLAYAIDRLGRRLYTLHILDTTTGELVGMGVAPVTGEFEWSEDEQAIFYLQQDPETLRSDRLRLHRLGADPGQDPVLYFEEDPTFSLGLARTASGRFLVLTSRQTLTTECRIFPARVPASELAPLLVRERGREYFAEHLESPEGDEVLLLVNDRGRNFRLVAAPWGSAGDPCRWRELVPCREDVLLVDVRPYRAGIALLERCGGLPRIRVVDRTGKPLRTLVQQEAAYVLDLDPRGDFEGPLRFGYTSLTTPWTVFEEDLATGERSQLYREPVGGGFDPSRYRTERRSLEVRDGAKVPVTLLFRNDLAEPARAPMLLEGYGAYGINLEPVFDASLFSLVDRGWLIGLIHVRGGQELGRHWYEQGRGRAKRHTFEDFVDVAEGLPRQGIGNRERLFAWGGSAGGLLVGVVLNERPELLRGAIAAVPFVDVVTTMSDPSIPLTTGEYDEWGNPGDPEDLAYLLGYSPYDNVRPQAYPHLLVTSGFWDSQVQYWEPAKWVARLRKLRTDRSRLLLLKTDFEAGHSGVSGRYRRLEQRALEWTFLLLADRL